MVLAAVVATRWFDERRGLVLGALSAANATGQLVFLPALATITESSGWRSATLVVAAAGAVTFVIVLLFMRDRPEDIGLLPYGQRAAVTPAIPARSLAPIEALRHAMESRAFWILAGTFFVCGASTNGLIGTHLIAACHDVGIPETRAAQLLAVMGIFDILGTTASGWLTDRFSSRYLLFGYYTVRGVSLLFLPLTLSGGATQSLGVFAVFYGLDWVARFRRRYGSPAKCSDVRTPASSTDGLAQATSSARRSQRSAPGPSERSAATTLRRSISQACCASWPGRLS